MPLSKDFSLEALVVGVDGKEASHFSFPLFHASSIGSGWFGRSSLLVLMLLQEPEE